MNMATMTSTAAAAAATTSATHMDMDMDVGTCKVGSMLWNWYTIDACFISTSWHITSNGMFAGSCIGVILLVMTLEFLRRTAKEYDRHITRQFQRSLRRPPPNPKKSFSDDEKPIGNGMGMGMGRGGAPIQFRPNLFQQAVRATFHMLQFTVAYFVMLLAMYYNGYLIICIIIGAWLGAFVFGWETIDLSGIGPQEEATLCCG